MGLDQIVFDFVQRRLLLRVLHLRPQVRVDDVIVGMLGQIVTNDGGLVREIARIVAQVAVNEARLVHGTIGRQTVVEHDAFVGENVSDGHVSHLSHAEIQ